MSSQIKSNKKKPTSGVLIDLRTQAITMLLQYFPTMKNQTPHPSESILCIPPNPLAPKSKTTSQIFLLPPNQLINSRHPSPDPRHSRMITTHLHNHCLRYRNCLLHHLRHCTHLSLGLRSGCWIQEGSDYGNVARWGDVGLL